MHLAFALPSPAETGSGGGTDYIDGLATGLRTIGIQVDLLRGNHPVFPAESIPVVDGMLLPRLHDRIDELIQRRAIALIHHVAAAASRDEPDRTQTLAVVRSMLLRMSQIVATSTPVAQRLADEFGVTARAIPPGIRDVATSTPDPGSPIVLSVGVLTRRKGHDRLIESAARLLDLPWQLVIAGDAQRDPNNAGELRNLADDLGLASRVTVLPNPGSYQLEAEWRRATVFVSATRWEGYPNAIAEAMCRGIPCLTTAHANADAILPPTAGVILPSDDTATFGKCLRRLLFDGDLRTDMAAAARVAGQTLPRWPDRAREFISFLEQ